LHKQTGIPPVVAQGNEQEVKSAADVNSLDYEQLVASHPRTVKWASNPDNAAVSGADEVQRLARIESHIGNIRALTPWESLDMKYLAPARQKLMGFPVSRMAIDAVAGTSGMVGNIASFFGVHGDGPTKQNALQRFESYLSPENADLNVNGRADTGNALDTIVKNVAPMIPAVIASGGTGLLARTLGISGKAAKVLAGFAVGGMFTADQGGSTYTQMSASGASDDEARLAANRVGLINAPLNFAFGATDLVPFLKRNPLMTSMILGGAQGGTGQVAQNLVTGQPLSTNVLESSLQGMAVQGGMHLGMGFFEDMAHIVTAADESKLRQRSPEKFHEAMTELFDGQQSLRIPVEQFETYFQSKSINPAQVAEQLGVKNYAEAKVSGGDVEVAPADFIGKLDPEHQKGLLGDIVNPASGMTLNQQAEGEQELQKWVAEGGPEKLSTETAKADAETQASDEYQSVKTQLRQQYIDAGETPEIAENYATLQANVYSNLARETGLKPSELMGLYRPVVKVGEAPGASLSQDKRGWFRPLPDGSFEIGKTQIGDLSTFIHEPAHSYLEIIRDLAVDKNASEGLKSDYGKILEFLGAKDGEALTTEQHEKWARANEQYLREGIAPSEGLRGVFQRFAVWLSTIYKRASDLGVELSDDIRGVFDRMYASEEGVNRAEKESGPHLFSTPEEAGWTPEQFQKYADSKGMEVEQAKSEILDKLNEAAVRERTDAWREEEKNVREAVATEIDAKQEYQAIRALRDGKLKDGTELKLNRDELVKQFGEERVKELQKQHPGLYRKEGGVDADIAAEILGYGSGDEMLRALTAAPRRSQAIEQATRDFMTAKHGDIRYDGSLQDQARIALENDRRAANLHKELKQLQKKLAETETSAQDEKSAAREIKVAPIEAYREAAKQAVQSKSLADMQPTRYLDASRKFSREAFDALRSGKTEEAALAKHKELMNHFLFREASKARDKGDIIETYAKRMSQAKELGKLGLAGQPFLEQIQSFLARYSFDRGRSLSDIQQPKTETLDQFVTRMKTDENLDLPVDPSLLNESQRKNYRNVPFSELEAVYDAMRSIEHAAKLVNSVRAEGKRVALAQASADLGLKLEDSLGKPEVRKASDQARSFLERVKDVNLDIAALLPEFMFERFDGLEKQGPWHDYFWNRYNDAADHQNRLRELVFPKIMELRETKIDRSKKFYIQSIDRTLSKDDIISIALNSGNESNLEKQMKGGIQFEKNDVPVRLDARSLQEILSHLTPDEIKMVNGVWKTIGLLKPEAAALERKRTGIEPKWIEPKAMEVANGTLEGGYYPLKYDPRFSAAGEKQSDASTVTQMFAKYASTSTRQGYLKARTEFYAPLTLDWQATVSRHLDEVTTDISHWEFATDAQRLLKNADVKASIMRHLGNAYYKNLLDWVRYTVNQDSMGREASDNIDRFRRTMRNNVSTAVLGFRVMNAVVETGITPIMALQHVSPEAAFKGAMTYLRNPIEATKFAVEASDYVKSIDKEMDRNITEALNDLAGKTSLLSNVRRWAIMSRVAIWKIGAVMAWHQGYVDAMKQGLEGKDAVRIADSIYRMTQESGRPGDLSAVQRNPYMKELTMFIGPSLIQYNNNRRAVMAFKDMGFNSRTVALGLTTLLAGHVVNNVLFNVFRGKGPNEPDKWPSWLLARLTFGLADGFPIARDVAGYAEGKLLGEHGKDFRLSPVLQAGKDTIDAALDTAHVFTGETTPGKAIKQDLRALGSLTGFPAVQGDITGEYIYDVLSGEYKPAHPWSPVTDAFYARPTKR
jgi:hypothetical protein